MKRVRFRKDAREQQEQPAPTNRLFVDKLRSIGFVPKGSNPGSDVTFFKRDGEDIEKARNVAQFLEGSIHRDFTNMADGLFMDGYLTREQRIGLSNAIGEGLQAFSARVSADWPELLEQDPFEPVGKIDGGAGEGTLRESGGDASIEGTSDMPDNVKLTDDQLAELDPVVRTYLEGVEKRPTVEQVEETVAKAVEAAVAEALAKAAADDGDEVDVLKDADPAIVAMIEKANAATAEAQKVADAATEVAAEEREIRLAKAAEEHVAQYTNLVDDAPVMAPVIRKMRDVLDPEELKLADALFESADARLADEAFFKTFGSGGGGGGSMTSAESNVDALAKERVAKGDGTETYHQAYAAILDENRDLSEQVRKEHTDKGGK